MITLVASTRVDPHDEGANQPSLVEVARATPLPPPSPSGNIPQIRGARVHCSRVIPAEWRETPASRRFRKKFAFGDDGRSGRPDALVDVCFVTDLSLSKREAL